MENIPDHPIIRNCERYGYPDGPQEEKIALCPICGKETDTFYIQSGNVLREIIGCSHCVRVIDSWEEDL